MTAKTLYPDTPKTQGMRRKLVEAIRNKGISDENVLNAIDKVPRHYFLDPAFLSQAYDDKAFAIGAGQTISQPYTVAFQTALLDIKKNDKALEIGTGSGYQTCVLLQLKARVFSIERQKELFDKTKKLLPAIGYSPNLFYGDGYKGLPSFAPFDKILVTCGAPYIPDELLSQLKPGGIMVIPVGTGSIQTMTKLTKATDGTIDKQELGKFSFVPMLGEKEWGGR